MNRIICTVGLLCLGMGGGWQGFASAGENDNDDSSVAVCEPLAAARPRSLMLEPVESLDVPHEAGNDGLVRRVHLYADAEKLSKIYLVAEINEEKIEIVGIFDGWISSEKEQLSLQDLDGDGFPELILRYEAGTGTTHVRVFVISREPFVKDSESCITASPLLPQVGHFVTSVGDVAVHEDGLVEVTFPGHAAERIPASPTKRYRMADGVMKEVGK